MLVVGAGALDPGLIRDELGRLLRGEEHACELNGLRQAWLVLDEAGRPDGAVEADGRIAGERNEDVPLERAPHTGVHRRIRSRARSRLLRSFGIPTEPWMASVCF